MMEDLDKKSFASSLLGFLAETTIKEVIAQLGEAFVQTALEEFKTYNFNCIPLYPAVLIRVLPKEKVSASGLIFFPDEKVNKPVYEGIVIRTWPDKTILKNKKEYTLKCPVVPGDIIAFPHWSGEHVPGLESTHQNFGEDKYRLVPIRDYFSSSGNPESGEPYCIIARSEDELNPKEKVVKVLEDLIQSPRIMQSEAIENAVEELFDNFDISVKIKASKTRSGA